MIKWEEIRNACSKIMSSEGKDVIARSLTTDGKYSDTTCLDEDLDAAIYPRHEELKIYKWTYTLDHRSASHQGQEDELNRTLDQPECPRKMRAGSESKPTGKNEDSTPAVAE